MNEYYIPGGAGEPGTLYNVRNLLKHKSIKDKVMDNVNQVVDLLNTNTCGMVTLLAMDILEMADIDEDPPTSPILAELDDRRTYLMDVESDR